MALLDQIVLGIDGMSKTQSLFDGMHLGGFLILAGLVEDMMRQALPTQFHAPAEIQSLSDGIAGCSC